MYPERWPERSTRWCLVVVVLNRFRVGRPRWRPCNENVFHLEARFEVVLGLVLSVDASFDRFDFLLGLVVSGRLRHDLLEAMFLRGRSVLVREPRHGRYLVSYARRACIFGDLLAGGVLHEEAACTGLTLGFPGRN